MAAIARQHSTRAGSISGKPRQGRRWGLRAIRKALLAGSVLALLGTGCNLTYWAHNHFKVGPNYSPPPAPVAEEWIDYKDPRVKSEETDLSEWWRIFKDPALDDLMEKMYQQNISLRVAGSRILEARAIRGIAVGELFPQQQNAFGSYTLNKLSNQIASTFPDLWFSNWIGGFQASWELDFWGRFRRGVEAANAELDASVENYDDVLVLLLADVASNYTQIRIFQERLYYTWRNVVIQTRSYQLALDKHEAGATTERDVQQAKQVLEQTRALVPQLETGLRLANNRLCILLGIPPRELTELGVGKYERSLQQLAKDKKLQEQKDVPAPPGLIPCTPDTAVVGIPADLLRRRPDVRRAERQVAAQSARIGIAESDFYPHLALNGTIGLAAEEFGDLWRLPGASIGSFGPSFTWNILNYGRIRNRVRVEDARFQQLAFTYQDTVLKAGREVEDGLVSFLKAQERTGRLRDSVQAAAETVRITYDQYKAGAVDFTAVFLFEGTLTDQQDQEVLSRGDITLSLINVYRSLGGGWEMRLSRDGDHDGHDGHGGHGAGCLVEVPAPQAGPGGPVPVPLSRVSLKPVVRESSSDGPSLDPVPDVQTEELP